MEKIEITSPDWMDRLICFFKDHDYVFSYTAGLMDVSRGTVVTYCVDAAEWRCRCQRCGKTYTQLQTHSQANHKPHTAASAKREEVRESGYSCTGNNFSKL